MNKPNNSAVVSDSPTLKVVKRTAKSYNHFKTVLGKQFKNIDKLTKLYINAQGKVYAAEWLDANGVINFNAGYAIDLVKTVEYVD